MMEKIGKQRKTDNSIFEVQKKCGQKASAKPIQEKSFCLLLNPKRLE